MISDSTVGTLLSPGDVLGVIAGAFAVPLVAPPRSVAACREGAADRALLAMPALRPGGIASVKVVQAASAGLTGYLLALDHHGALIAVIEAHRLTALRTAAVSVLAAQTLGAAGARRLGVLGAGRQARAHIEAYAVALAIEEVTIWSRRDRTARELAAYAEEHLCAVRVATTAADAAAHADIVVCATPATAPLLTGAMVSRAHVDLVGGFRPDMREADDALMAGASIVVDTPAALDEAGDLAQPIASGIIARDHVVRLGDILAGRAPVPRSAVTVFKSVGHATQDLVVAELLLARLGLLGDTRAKPGARTEAASYA